MGDFVGDRVVGLVDGRGVGDAVGMSDCFVMLFEDRNREI